MGNNYTAENREIKDTLRERELFPSTSAPWQQGVLNSYLKKIETHTNAVCLDAACGVGNNTELLTKHCSVLQSFDKSTKAVDFARERCLATNLDNVSLTVNSLEHIPNDNDSYDLVVCTEALEHVQDVKHVIDELTRVTKPGGYVLLSFQNHFNFSAIVKYVYEKVHKRNWDVWGTHRHEEGYENYLTCFEIKKATRDAGLISIHETGADYINAWLSWIPYFYTNYEVLDRYPLLLLGKLPLIKYLGMDYFMLLKKP